MPSIGDTIMLGCKAPQCGLLCIGCLFISSAHWGTWISRLFSQPSRLNSWASPLWLLYCSSVSPFPIPLFLSHTRGSHCWHWRAKNHSWKSLLTPRPPSSRTSPIVVSHIETNQGIYFWPKEAGEWQWTTVPMVEILGHRHSQSLWQQRHVPSERVAFNYRFESRTGK